MGILQPYPPFTDRERVLAACVADLLRAFSAVLLVALVLWSVDANALV